MFVPFKNCPTNIPYKVSLILTELISIRILRMRLISTITNLYWSHPIALQKLSNERSYMFSWLLWSTTNNHNDISIINLYFYPLNTNTNTIS